MIRVLHTIDTTGPGGAETVFINLAIGLDPKQYKSVVVIHGSGWVLDTLRKNNIEPYLLSSKGGYDFHYLWELVKIVREYHIDIIQSHLPGSNLYCSMAGLICRVPVVTTFHGFDDFNIKERFIGLKRWLISLGSKKMVFVSDRLREHYVNSMGFTASKSITIYNGVKASHFSKVKDQSIRKKLGLGPKDILIGAVGNIRPAKGYDLLLKAARRVYEQHPDCRFVVAGQRGGELYKGLLKLREELNLVDKFYFIGFQNDIAKLFNNLDIFVLSSTTEGFSISTIEAMNSGLPVVVTRSGGPEEFVTHNKNGIIVKCDERQLASAITCLIENEKFREKIAEAAKESVTANYTINEMINNYLKIYNSTVYKPV